MHDDFTSQGTSQGTSGSATPLALVLAALALLVSGYLWFDRHRHRLVFESDLPAAVIKLRADVGALRQSGEGAATRLESLRRAHSDLGTTVEALGMDIQRNRERWMAIEAQELLTVAAQRLALASDARGALAALRGADGVLAALGRPQDIDLRRDITRAIQTLEARARQDDTSLALRLLTATEGLDRLPFRPGVVLEGKAPARAHAREGKSFFQDLIGLMHIRTDERDARPLIAPERALFVRENLRLELTGARLALLRSDRVTATASIDQALKWLAAWFDPRDPGVAALSAEIHALRAAASAPPLPDLSGLPNRVSRARTGS